MADEMLILLSDCCLKLGIEEQFVLALSERGLLRTVSRETTIYIEISELPRLEKITRLSSELEINIPGIEAVLDLTERMEHLQNEIIALENRLRKYE